ncbi:MAG TPA: universal stress protein [Gaiellales bacterium]|jgi:nucleotide-binding universal stress UspA family protein
MGIVIQPRRTPRIPPRPRPVIAAVDGSAAGRVAADEAIASARDLRAPVLFVHVRRGPSTVWGRPFYQRRLERALRKGREAVAAAAARARTAGVAAQTEILEGPPGLRIAELARSRDAQLVIVGPRGRRLRASVFRRVAAMGFPVRRASSSRRPAHA